MPITFNMMDGSTQSWSQGAQTATLGGSTSTSLPATGAGNEASSNPSNFIGPENVTQAVLTGAELTALLGLNFLPLPLQSNPPDTVTVNGSLAQAIYQAIQSQTILNLLNGS